MIKFDPNKSCKVSRYGTELWMKLLKPYSATSQIIENFTNENWSEHPLKLGLKKLLQECFFLLSFIPEPYWNNLIVRFTQKNEPTFWYVTLTYRPTLKVYRPDEKDIQLKSNEKRLILLEVE